MYMYICIKANLGKFSTNEYANCTFLVKLYMYLYHVLYHFDSYSVGDTPFSVPASDGCYRAHVPSSTNC